MKLKLILSAIVLATSANAMAANSNTVDKPSGGNSEMLFQLYDLSSGRLFVYDLTPIAGATAFGTFTLNDFLPKTLTNAQGSPDLAALTPAQRAVPSVLGFNAAGAAENYGTSLTWTNFGAAFNAFKAANTTEANWRWNIVAGDDLGDGPVLNDVRYLSTFSDTVLPFNQDLGNFIGMSSKSGHFDAISDEFSYSATDADSVYMSSYNYNTEFGNWGGTTELISSSLNESAAMFYLTGADMGAINQQFQSNGRFAFTKDGLGNFALSYTTDATAPIPEADTSAMLLAGIGLMGMIARRRKSIK
jgi:hypothetical protein